MFSHYTKDKSVPRNPLLYSGGHKSVNYFVTGTRVFVSLLLSRSLGPHLNRTHGMGMRATDMKAKTLVAHPTPR